MARYLVIYSVGDSVADGKSYFYETRSKKDYMELLEAIEYKGYTIIHKSHDLRKEKRHGK